MAASELRAKWAAGPLEAATHGECPPWPAPGHGHRHVSLSGQGSVYFQGEAGSGFQVGVHGNTALTHTLSRAALRCSSATEPHSAHLRTRLPGWQPVFREGWKSQFRDAHPVGASPSPLSTSPYPSQLPQEDKAHPGHWNGTWHMRRLQAGPGKSPVPDAQRHTLHTASSEPSGLGETGVASGFPPMLPFRCPAESRD